MGCFLLAVVSLGFARCTPMEATATCSYDLGVKYAEGRVLAGHWDRQPNGKCSFTIKAPVRRAKDAEAFARAYEKLVVATPAPEGIPQPVKIEKAEAR